MQEGSARRVSPERLRRFCIAALVTAGLREADAQTTAEVLVTTDAMGVFSHGTAYLRNYVHKIRAGGIDTTTRPEVVLEGPVWAIIDGHSSMAMETSCMAMETAIRKAAAAGIGYVGVRNSNHFGAAGYYARMAIKHDMIGIAMSNADNSVTAPGGRSPVIGTNPFAYAAPAGEEWPIFLDIALSTLSATKIHTAKLERKTIPEGLLVDAEGLPTTDYGDWPILGALWPVAGHKGYGLALMVELLAGVLTGAAVTSQVKGWIAQLAEPPGTGHAFIAIDIGKIMPIDEFKQRMDEMIRGIREAPKAKGAERIFLPGEMEWEAQEVALKEGIAFPERILGLLATLAIEVGLDFESLFQ